MWFCDPLDAKTLIQCILRHAPGLLCFGPLGTAGFRNRYQATAGIGACANRQPPLCHQGLKIARQGRRIHLQMPRQVTWAAQGPAWSHGTQGILRILQLGLTHVMIVMPCHQTIELAPLL